MLEHMYLSVVQLDKQNNDMLFLTMYMNQTRKKNFVDKNADLKTK